MITESTTVTTFKFATFIPNAGAVTKGAEARLPTDFGEFQIAGYRSLVSDEEFDCVSNGAFSEEIAVPVLIHSQSRIKTF